MKSLPVDKKSNSRSVYQPDLDEFLSQCEVNYWLFQRLSGTFQGPCGENPDLTVNMQKWCIQVEKLQLLFEVVDIARYTLTLKLIIAIPRVEHSGDIELIVRLYHDAKMLEVMEGHGPAALKAIQKKDSAKGKPVDEKRQINRFVGESFRACLGYSDSLALSPGR